MIRITAMLRLAAAGFVLVSLAAQAKVAPDEVARLGQDLTPVGAERAGNKDGSIPAWTPGKQSGALKGEFPADPALDAQKPLFAITAANMQHA